MYPLCLTVIDLSSYAPNPATTAPGHLSEDSLSLRTLQYPSSLSADALARL